MKFLVSLFLFAISFHSSGQNLLKKEGCMKIEMRRYFPVKNRNIDRSIKKVKKDHRYHLILYFDTLGNELKRVHYGKHHNADDKVLDYIYVNNYQESRLMSTIEYHTDYQNNISPEYRDRYFYDSLQNLTRIEKWDNLADTLEWETDYEYDSIGNNISIQSNGEREYTKTFDSLSRLIIRTRIYKNKPYWQYTYTYTDTTKIGDFQTFYAENNYTKREIRTYRNNRLIQYEEYNTPQKQLSSKQVIEYDEFGLIKRISFYEAYLNEEYKFHSYTLFNAKTCRTFKKDTINRINETLLKDE